MSDASAPRRLNIALDYDDTVTADPDLWYNVVLLMQKRKHNVMIVTMRRPDQLDGGSTFEPLDPRFRAIMPVYTTSALGKRKFMEEQGIQIDIWIDDCPEYVTHDYQVWQGIRDLEKPRTVILPNRVLKY